MTKEFKPLGKKIIIKAVIKTQTKSGIVLNVESDMDYMTRQQKHELVEKEIVFAVGDEVKKVKVGDEVVVNKRESLKVNLIDKLGMEKEEDITYYSTEEDKILGIIK